MSLKTIILIPFAMFMIACSQDPAYQEIEQSPNAAAQTSGGGVGETQNEKESSPAKQVSQESGKPPVTIEEIRSHCELARTSGTLKTFQKVITFPKADAKCAWGQNGNLSMDGDKIRARVEQTIDVAIPNASALCEFSLTSSKQTMRYDDEMLVVAGDLRGKNLVLAASLDYSQSAQFPTGLAKDSLGFVEYSWDRMLNLPYFHSLAPLYCAGGASSQCVFPSTEQTGPINLAFHPDVAMKVGATLLDFAYDQGVTNASLPMSFVTLGDNDDATDCKHDAFTMTVKSVYVPQD
jgi:hypothetical protein